MTLKKEDERIDPESLKGKILILVFDKIFLGLIIAIAFVVYDQYKSNQESIRNNQAQAIQLDYERAKSASEYLPIIMNSKNEVLERAYVLRAAVLTKSIDKLTGMNILCKLYKDKLNNFDFLQVAQVCLPEGLQGILDNVPEMHVTGNFDMAVPGVNSSNIDSTIDALAMFREAVENGIKNYGIDSFQLLNNHEFMYRNMYKLYGLLGSTWLDASEVLSFNSLAFRNLTLLCNVIDGDSTSCSVLARNLNYKTLPSEDSLDFVLTSWEVLGNFSGYKRHTMDFTDSLYIDAVNFDRLLDTLLKKSPQIVHTELHSKLRFASFRLIDYMWKVKRSDRNKGLPSM